MCLAVTQWLDRTPLSPWSKEVFDAETFAVYQALRASGRRQECGYRYTIFVDSTAAIDRVRADALGPGQRFAIAAMEPCDRFLACDYEVTIRWVPTHSMVVSNK